MSWERYKDLCQDVYRKFDVHNRIEAVEKWESLGSARIEGFYQ